MNRNDIMTFKEYLEKQGINNSTPDPEAIVYATITAMRPDITYREASLIFVGLPVISETFENLWYAYESELDRQNYEREHNEPEHIADITKQILKKIYPGDEMPQI